MDYDGMSRPDLESALKHLQSTYEDLEEAIRFNFFHSAAHISGSQVRKDEASLREIHEKIAKVKETLSRAAYKPEDLR